MKHSEARAILGLDNTASSLTEEIVVTAWRAAVKHNHPDMSPDAKASNLHTIDQLTKAKKTLLDSLNGADFACGTCGGSGKVRGRVGLRECATCKGTGDKR